MENGKGNQNGNHAEQNMDTNKNNNQLHISDKERKQNTGQKKWNAKQVVFPFLCSRLFYNEV